MYVRRPILRGCPQIGRIGWWGRPLLVVYFEFPAYSSRRTYPSDDADNKVTSKKIGIKLETRQKLSRESHEKSAKSCWCDLLEVAKECVTPHMIPFQLTSINTTIIIRPCPLFYLSPLFATFPSTDMSRMQTPQRTLMDRQLSCRSPTQSLVNPSPSPWNNVPRKMFPIHYATDCLIDGNHHKSRFLDFCAL